MATLGNTDLWEVVDYLDGLLILLRDLHARRVGADESDPLMDALASDGRLTNVWEPLRYQGGGLGMGWEFVAKNLLGLRNRVSELVEDV